VFFCACLWCHPRLSARGAATGKPTLVPAKWLTAATRPRWSSLIGGWSAVQRGARSHSPTVSTLAGRRPARLLGRLLVPRSLFLVPTDTPPLTLELLPLSGRPVGGRKAANLTTRPLTAHSLREGACGRRKELR